MLQENLVNSNQNHGVQKKIWGLLVPRKVRISCGELAKMHYKKTVLLQRAKTAAKAQKTVAKGTFNLQRRVLLRRFFPSLLRSKSTIIDLPFSGAFGLLRRGKNRRHMRLPLGSSDLLAEGNKRYYQASCTTDPMYLLTVVLPAAICLKLQRRAINAAISLQLY